MGHFEHGLRRRRFGRNLLLVSLCVVAVAIGLLAALGSGTHIRYRDFERVTEGMTLSEIEWTLGAPGTEYPPAGVRTFAWQTSDGALITVLFDRKGQAQRIHRFASSESFWDKTLRLLRISAANE